MKQGIFFVALSILAITTYAQTKKPSVTTASQKKPVVSAISSIKARIAAGKEIYAKHCLSCHQADGFGVPGMNPPLVKTKWVLGDKKKLITLMIKGMNETIVINDDEFHNPMPPHANLNDQQIADVLTFVRNNFGNKASTVSPSEVKTVRASIK